MINRTRLLAWESVFLVLFLLYAGSPPAWSQEGRKLLKKVDPTYPELAQKMNLRGAVRVEIAIAANGSVQNVTVLGGHPVLSAAVADAVKQWKYASGPEETKKILEFKF